MKANVIARVAQWLANEVIVKGLANSTIFQNFAVRSHGAVRQYAERSATALRDLQSHEAVETARARGTGAAGWVRDFGQGLTDAVKGAAKSGSGGGGSGGGASGSGSGGGGASRSRGGGYRA